MEIERTEKEIIIRIPTNVDTLGLQRIIDYLRYKEATATSKAKWVQLQKSPNLTGGRRINLNLLSEDSCRYQHRL